jgi:hypothetical protein
MKRVLILVVSVLVLATLPAPAGQGRRRAAPPDNDPTISRPTFPREELPEIEEKIGLRYRITASRPRLNRRLMGPVRRWVGRVAAEPVDSFCWSGEGSVPIKGTMTIDVEPMRNVGKITAEWTDHNGTWTWTQKRFLHPDHHSSGVRIGSSVFRVDTVINEAIVHNVYLHGDTAAGQPVLPTVFTYLAAWGPGYATLNGERFDNEFEIPAPQWLGHIMVTEGARREDGSVRTLSGEIYNPSRGDDGAVEVGDIEAHLTFHDDVFPLTTSVPPLFSFFYHLVFEDVRIEIIQADGP